MLAANEPCLLAYIKAVLGPETSIRRAIKHYSITQTNVNETLRDLESHALENGSLEYSTENMELRGLLTFLVVSVLDKAKTGRT